MIKCAMPDNNCSNLLLSDVDYHYNVMAGNDESVRAPFS